MPGESSSETGNPYGRMHVTEPVRATIPVQNGARLSWDPWICFSYTVFHDPVGRSSERILVLVFPLTIDLLGLETPCKRNKLVLSLTVMLTLSRAHPGKVVLFQVRFSLLRNRLKRDRRPSATIWPVRFDNGWINNRTNQPQLQPEAPRPRLCSQSKRT